MAVRIIETFMYMYHFVFLTNTVSNVVLLIHNMSPTDTVWTSHLIFYAYFTFLVCERHTWLPNHTRKQTDTFIGILWCLSHLVHIWKLPGTNSCRWLQKYHLKQATTTSLYAFPIIIIIIIIIIGIQPLGRFGQRPELSQSTGIALVRCILGKFLLVVCHCFPPLFRLQIKK